MLPLMALLIIIPLAILLGLDPMVTADITVTQHKMVMRTLVQIPAADVLLIGCPRHHHSLVLQVTNIIKKVILVDEWYFRRIFGGSETIQPYYCILYSCQNHQKGERQGREFVYIKDHSSSVSSSHGLARVSHRWMMDSRFTRNPLVIFYSIFPLFYIVLLFLFLCSFLDAIDVFACIDSDYVYFPSLMAL